ncbi:hypothetical protein FB379_12145 [Aeribacillus composti]|nr:hypothetical protein FB379_12145 [Aeribacillus composti]
MFSPLFFIILTNRKRTGQEVNSPPLIVGLYPTHGGREFFETLLLFKKRKSALAIEFLY